MKMLIPIGVTGVRASIYTEHLPNPMLPVRDKPALVRVTGVGRRVRR